jgi:hypothetical protein
MIIITIMTALNLTCIVAYETKIPSTYLSFVVLYDQPPRSLFTGINDEGVVISGELTKRGVDHVILIFIISVCYTDNSIFLNTNAF